MLQRETKGAGGICEINPRGGSRRVERSSGDQLQLCYSLKKRRGGGSFMATIKNDTVSASRLQGLNGYPRYLRLIYVTHKPFATPVAPSPYRHFHVSPKGKTQQKLTYLFIFYQSLKLAVDIHRCDINVSGL